MKRIVKEPMVRRNEILDVVERLVSTKGYEQMAIQDIMDELQIAKGTVYHYFDSKAALLEALVERMGDQIEQLVLPIVHDPKPGALDKLLRYFAAIDHLKLAHQHLMIEFLHVWYDDENAIVHRKLYRAGVKRFSPWLAQIIQQGVGEGVFTTAYPDQAARMIITLRYDLGDAIAELLLAEERALPVVPRIAQIAEATVDALERVLGAKSGCLQDAWREALSQWQLSPI
ncbi:MAG: TetR/AcrR family transcriptional regulator [Ktedonobacteraceae bacterium]